jgi:SOS-response transcriptional repressor LexA
MLPYGRISYMQTAKITTRQEKVLSLIENFISQHKYPPTLRELQSLMKIKSHFGIVRHVEKLKAKGYIRKYPLIARGLKVIRPVNEYRKATKESICSEIREVLKKQLVFQGNCDIREADRLMDSKFGKKVVTSTYRLTEKISTTVNKYSPEIFAAAVDSISETLGEGAEKHKFQ